jgi:hypothetical protein
MGILRFLILTLRENREKLQRSKMLSAITFTSRWFRRLSDSTCCFGAAQPISCAYSAIACLAMPIFLATDSTSRPVT